MRPTRLWLLLVPVLLLSACSDDDDEGGGGATTTTRPAAATTEAGAAAVPEADAKLITELWAGKSAAYERGKDAVATFIYENNYPDLQATETLEKCRQAVAQLPDGYREDNVVSTDTIRRDDEWNPEIGNVQSPPKGRTYAMTLTISVTRPGEAPQQATGGAHVTVLDGKAYFFFPCQA